MKSALTASLQSVLSAAVLAGMMMLCGGMPQAFAAPPPDGNIIANPGFEAPDDPVWTGSEAVLLRSSEQAHSGKWSLRIQDRSNTVSGSANSVPVSVSLQGGGRFYAEAWIKIDAESKIRTGYGAVAVDIIQVCTLCTVHRQRKRIVECKVMLYAAGYILLRLLNHGL